MTPGRSVCVVPLLTLSIVLTAAYLLADGTDAATVNVDTDWVVDSNDDIRSDDIYVMRANLTVTGTGQISFRRCKFTFMSESPGDYGVTVEPGGYLTLHTCNLQSGYLAPTVLAEPWTFHVQDSGRLSLQSSTVLDLGVIGGANTARGLAIESDNVMVSGTTFEECNRGIIVLGGASPQIVDNTFEDNQAGVEVIDGPFHLGEENLFKENQVGMLFQTVSSGYLGAGRFVDNPDSLRAVQSNVRVENVTLTGMGDGIVAEVASNVVVENCSVSVIFNRGVAHNSSRVDFINCDVLSWSSLTTTDANSHITAKMGVRFKVTFSGVDYPVEDADVELATNEGNKVYQQVTGSDGMSPLRLITVFEHHNGQRAILHGPFDATATLGYNYEELEDVELEPNHLIEMTFTDEDAPDLQVQLPVEGTFYKDVEVRFKGRLSDLHSGISMFHYSVNGGDNVSIPIEDPWETMVVLPEGELELVFTAVDLLGNRVNVSRTVTVDLTAPVPTDLDPPVGTVTRSYQLLLNGTTEPGATLSVQGDEWEVSPNGSFSGYITLGDEEGEQTVNLRFADQAGNEGVFQYTLLIDRTKPMLQVYTAPDHLVFPYVNESAVRVFGETEPGATVKVQINTDLMAEAVADENGSWSADIDLVLGENDLLVDAWDPAGNRRSYEVIDFFYDVTPPEIALLVPEDGAVFKNKVTSIYVKARTEPDATIWVNDEAEQIQPGHGEVEFHEVDLPYEGNNTITVYAMDKAGNLGTHTIVVVRQEKADDDGNDTDGFPAWTVLVAIAVVAVTAVVAQRLFLKER